MTESEWNSCTDPPKMLHFLRNCDKVSQRKLRLFAVACCREVWYFLGNPQCRDAVAVSERFADGLATPLDLDAANQAVSRSIPTPKGQPRGVSPHPDTREGASYYAAERASWPMMWHVGDVAHAARVLSPRNDMALRQCNTLRDIFGPLPFRSVVVNPLLLNWKDGLIVKLAQAVYNERILPEGTLDQSRLTALADALQEVGTTEQDVLGHLRRQNRSHVRGFWVLDLLLSKE